MNAKNTGLFLQTLRKQKGLTQNQVAQKLFISPKTISKWERGEGLPDITLLSSLAAFYGVTTDEILNGSYGQSLQNDSRESALDNIRSRTIYHFKNVFFISLSLQILCAMSGIALSILIWSFNKYISPIYSIVIISSGLIISSLILIIGDHLIVNSPKNKASTNEEIKELTKEQRTRLKLLFSIFSVVCSIFLLILIKIYQTETNTGIRAEATLIKMDDYVSIILLGICSMVILNYLSEQNKGARKELGDYVFPCLVIYTIGSLFFLTFISFSFTTVDSVGNSANHQSSLLGIIFIFNTTVKAYTFRGIGLVFLISFLCFLILSFSRRQRRWMIGLSFISSVIFQLLCYFEILFTHEFTDGGIKYTISNQVIFSDEFSLLFVAAFLILFILLIISRRREPKADK